MSCYPPRAGGEQHVGVEYRLAGRAPSAPGRYVRLRRGPTCAPGRYVRLRRGPTCAPGRRLDRARRLGRRHHVRGRRVVRTTRGPGRPGRVSRGEPAAQIEIAGVVERKAGVELLLALQLGGLLVAAPGTEGRAAERRRHGAPALGAHGAVGARREHRPAVGAWRQGTLLRVVRATTPPQEPQMDADGTTEAPLGLPICVYPCLKSQAVPGLSVVALPLSSTRLRGRSRFAVAEPRPDRSSPAPAMEPAADCGGRPLSDPAVRVEMRGPGPGRVVRTTLRTRLLLRRAVPGYMRSRYMVLARRRTTLSVPLPSCGLSPPGLTPKRSRR